MKVLFVHTVSIFESVGGAEVSLKYLATSLAARGHECVVLVAAPGRGISRKVEQGVTVIEAGLRNIYWPFDKKDHTRLGKLGWHALDSYNPLMKRVVEQVCREEKPDVASVHNLPGWSVAAWDALTTCDVPIVQVLHDQYLLCANGTMYRNGHNCNTQCRSCALLRRPHPRRSRKLAAVVGVSRFILEHHVSNGYFHDVPIKRVVHNARSPAILGGDQNALAPQPTPTAGGVVFGFIGSLTPAKGIKNLIDAFADLSSESARLLIAGDASSGYGAVLRSETGDDRVRFLGRVAPRELFERIDVLVVPSQWRDTFPGVVFESLIFGRTVIAVDHGGAPEMIHHEKNGLLFKAGSQTALTDALTRVNENPELAAQLSRQARLDGREYLDVEGWVERYLEIYRDALDSRF
ncbi:glycosyltransferase family 4 protein [Salinisphaera sp. Q1T1-3]|uniref:glycosyltransferase family 4 protein n=1 Tax=Salinisphaera sp. Q1T1-3 TaxID=2321229 RepID=UPI000E75B974|nr:glycosyltransferase family 4 protein [Salinisphaera sp. Q1T1-3]RJS92645.1 glycosyltransferase [Salinisphaera sp. Q1T1-3]